MFKNRILGKNKELGDDNMRKGRNLRHIHFWTNERSSFRGDIIDQRVNEALSVNRILR